MPKELSDALECGFRFSAQHCPHFRGLQQEKQDLTLTLVHQGAVLGCFKGHSVVLSVFDVVSPLCGSHQAVVAVLLYNTIEL